MDILVVEDDLKERREFLAIIAEWEKKHQVIGLTVLSKVDDLNIQRQQGYHAIFLGIDLPGITGLQFAKELRKYNSRIDIIFVTKHRELCMQGFDVHAIGFLVKPIQKKQVLDILDFIEKRTLSNRESPICILTRNGQQNRYFADDILYIEASPHFSMLVMVNKTIKYSLPLVKMLSSLPSETFTQCHRSYIVNVKKVTQVKKESVVLVTGTELPIGRTYRNSLKQALSV